MAASKNAAASNPTVIVNAFIVDSLNKIYIFVASLSNNNKTNIYTNN